MKNLKCAGDKNCKTRSQLKNMVLGKVPINDGDSRLHLILREGSAAPLWLGVAADGAIWFHVQCPTHEPQPVPESLNSS